MKNSLHCLPLLSRSRCPLLCLPLLSCSTCPLLCLPCSHVQRVQEDFCLKAQTTTNHAVNPGSEGSWRLPAPHSVELRVPRAVQRGPRVFTSTFQARIAGSLWKRRHGGVQGRGERLSVKSGRNSTLQLPTALSVRSLKIAFLS